MKIAIIGAGNVGGALAKSSVRAGHSVTLSAKDPAHAEAKAKETGARAALRTVEATKGARPRRTARVSWSSSRFAFTVWPEARRRASAEARASRPCWRVWKLSTT